MDLQKYFRIAFVLFFMLLTALTIFLATQNYYEQIQSRKKTTRHQLASTRADCLLQYDPLHQLTNLKLALDLLWMNISIRVYGLFVFCVIGMVHQNIYLQYFYIGAMVSLLAVYCTGVVCVSLEELIGHLVLVGLGIAWIRNKKRQRAGRVREQLPGREALEIGPPIELIRMNGANHLGLVGQRRYQAIAEAQV